MRPKIQKTGVDVSLELWWRAALLTGLALLMQQAATAPAMAQTVSYSRDPNTVVASYRVDIGELADDDRGPAVRIYGDGQVRVHVPRYQKNSGDFTAQLSQAEMDNLMAALVANGVLDFDPAAVKQAKRAASQNRGGGGATVLSETSDPSVTTIELRVRPKTTSSGGGSAATGSGKEISKTVRWSVSKPMRNSLPTSMRSASWPPLRSASRLLWNDRI
jgi:hypothetical protein